MLNDILFHLGILTITQLCNFLYVHEIPSGMMPVNMFIVLHFHKMEK